MSSNSARCCGARAKVAVAIDAATADRREIAATRRVRRAGSGAACDVSAAGSAHRIATPSGTT